MAANKIFKQKYIKLFIPINLRNRKEKTENYQLQFLTSFIELKVNFDSHETLYKQIKNGIKESLCNQQHIKNLTLLNNALNNRKEDNNFLECFASVDSTICLSYAGNINNEATKLKLKELYLSVNCQAYYNNSASLTIQFVIIDKSEIFITINFPYLLVSSKKIIIFKRVFKKILIET